MTRSVSKLVLALALALAGCSGEIPGLGDDSKGGPQAGDPGNPAGPSSPVIPGPGPGPGDPPAPPPAATACTVAAYPRARIWRLSHAQLRNTLTDAFGFAGTAIDGLPPDSRLDGFANRADRLGLSPVLMEHYFRVGDEIGGEVFRRGAASLGCAPASLEGACLESFLQKVGRRAWRRPLESFEVQGLVTVYKTASAAVGAEAGLRSVVSALLLSPNFLYRTELGASDAKPISPGNVRLSDFELASALSYMLWDAPPDDALLDLAATGKLRDPATLAAEAKRLFASPKRAPEALGTFLRQWLKIDDFTAKSKDAALFPFWNVEVAKDLLEETRLFFDEVIFAPGGDRSLKTLLTASHGYVNARTAPIYGVTATGPTLARAPLDAKRRRGLFTSGAFLAAHAGADVTKVVDRGAFLREELLCGEVPAPPENFKFEDAMITEDMTAREKLLIHAKNPACNGCHKLFDGMGFALENYDAVGRFRETEKNKTIDPSGVVPMPTGGELRFSNFVDFIDQAVGQPDVYSCFATQYLSYATGRGLREIDDCERTQLLAAFAKSGYRIDGLVTGIVTSNAFATRKN